MTKIFFTKRFVFPIGLALLTSGCVTSSPYKADASHPIRTVTILRDVSMPEKMLFNGFSQVMAGMVFGPVGALATVFREGGDFKLPEVLRADLAAEMTRTGKFKVVSSGPADAEVQIRVREYGFTQAGMLQRRVKPILTIETQMLQRGVMVWKSGVVINQTTKGTPARLPEDLKNDPKVAVEALRVAAQIWASKTAESLK